MTEVLLIVICLGVGWGCFAAEPLFPSFGLLTVAGLFFCGYGIVEAFSINLVFGWSTAIVAVIGWPVGYFLGLRWIPHSPLALRTELPTPELNALGAGDRQDLQVGEIGKTVSALRPCGSVRFNHGVCECRAVQGVIPPQTMVEIIHVQGKIVDVGVRQGGSGSLAGSNSEREEGE